MTPGKNKRARKLPGPHWARIEANVWAVMIALLALLAGIAYVTVPEALQNSAQHQTFGDWAWAWLGAYGVAGAGILRGIWVDSPRAEAGSLVLLGTSAMLNATAILLTFGLVAFTGVLGQVAVVIACAVDVRRILQRRRKVLVQDLDKGQAVH